MTEVLSDAKPKLPRGVRLRHDDVRGAWILFAPERLFNPNPIAVEVLKLCDGEKTVADIVDELAKAFAAPREQIETDVKKMLEDLANKRVLDLA